ncbi:MAG: ferritin-like domain-containing protein [Thermoleophilaceae bacterium]
MPEATGKTADEGALEELARDPSSRKRFLTMVGGTGAAGALSVLIAACGGNDKKKSKGGTATKSSATRGDLEIVSYALTLEHLEVDFYGAVIKSGVIKDRKLAQTAQEIHANEQEHVAALTEAVKNLGGKPKRPRTSFDAVIKGGPKKVLETAAAVENLGAAAYLGQAGRINSKEILASALAIHTVEARHAAALNRALGKTIVPDGAFAKPASMAQVLPKVEPFLVK